MSSATEDPTGIPIPKNSTYLNYRQVQELKEDIAGMEKSLADPSSQFSDRGMVAKQLRQLRNDLETGAPPETTSEQRDALERERKRLIEKITDGMPSSEEMRKSPPGSQGKYEKHKKLTIADQIRYKNVMRTLHPDDDNPDLANLEMLRPRTSTLNMDNAFIPGRDWFIPPATQAYKEGYDRTFGPKNAFADPTEVAALKSKLEELEKRLEAQPVAAVSQKTLEARPFVAVASCGFEARGSKQHFADLGKKSHARRCAKCIALDPEGDTA